MKALCMPDLEILDLVRARDRDLENQKMAIFASKIDKL